LLGALPGPARSLPAARGDPGALRAAGDVRARAPGRQDAARTGADPLLPGARVRAGPGALRRALRRRDRLLRRAPRAPARVAEERRLDARRADRLHRRPWRVAGRERILVLSRREPARGDRARASARALPGGEQPRARGRARARDAARRAPRRVADDPRCAGRAGVREPRPLALSRGAARAPLPEADARPCRARSLAGPR